MSFQSLTTGVETNLNKMEPPPHWRGKDPILTYTILGIVVWNDFWRGSCSLSEKCMYRAASGQL